MEIVDELILAPVLEGIQKVKGKDIVVLDLSDISQSVCNNFVICSADSNTQVSAIADSVKEIVEEKVGEIPWSKEGLQNRQWVILDYVDVVVHIFLKEWRDFYDLEGLWGDAKRHVIEE